VVLQTLREESEARGTELPGHSRSPRLRDFLGEARKERLPGALEHGQGGLESLLQQRPIELDKKALANRHLHAQEVGVPLYRQTPYHEEVHEL